MLLIFLLFMNVLADFFKFIECHLFITNSRKTTENGFEHSLQKPVTEIKKDSQNHPSKIDNQQRFSILNLRSC